MSDQSNNSNNNINNNTNSTTINNYDDMINPPSWAVEPEGLEGLIGLINNMTISLENELNNDLSGNNIGEIPINNEAFSELLSDVDSDDDFGEGLETLFQDFDIQEEADIVEDTIFQGLHVEIPTVENALSVSGTTASAEELSSDGIISEDETQEIMARSIVENIDADLYDESDNDTALFPGLENHELVSDNDDVVSDSEKSYSIDELPIIEDCSVCYKPCTGENIVNTPCGHIYCTDCFFRWIRVRPTCPMCRRNFTSVRAMSNDEIRDDVHNITQIYRRTIIENDKLMYANNALTKKIKKNEKKNNKLSVESLAFITRLVSAREQLDFTKGYHNAIKDKSRTDLFEKLNIDSYKNTYLHQCNEQPYKNSPYNKGYRHGIYEYDYCINSFTKSETKKRRYSIPKWRKDMDKKMNDEKRTELKKLDEEFSNPNMMTKKDS